MSWRLVEAAGGFIITEAGGFRGGFIVEEAGGCDKVEALQLHENQTVYAKAAHLLDTYFSEEGAAEDPGVAPLATAEGFTFGVPGGAVQSHISLS